MKDRTIKIIYDSVLIYIIFYIINIFLIYTLDYFNTLHVNSILFIYFVFLTFFSALLSKHYGYKITFIDTKNIFKTLLLTLIVFYSSTLLFNPFYSQNNSNEFNFKNIYNNGNLSHLFLSIFIVPIFEEYFFRGFLLHKFIKHKKNISGIILVSALFALGHFHIFNLNINIDFVLMFFRLFVLGVLLSLTRIKFGLFYSIFGHAIYNLVSVLFTTSILNIYILDYVNQQYYWFIYSVFTLIVFLYLSLLFRR